MVEGDWMSNCFERGSTSTRILPTCSLKQTDDVGVFGSKLSNEYALIAEHFGLDKKEICDLARGAIETIFGNEKEKQRLREIMWK
jgi:adenosine deaminase